MSDLDEPLARALDEAVPRPPRELEPEAIRTAAVERPRRSALAPALVAAAMVAVAVTVAVLAGASAPDRTSADHSHPIQPPERATQPRSTGLDQEQRRVTARAVALTQRAVAELLAATPTPPGATSINHAPVKALEHPMEEPASPNLVRRTRWWTAPGTMADAIAYFTAHPPRHTTSSGSSSARGPGGTTTEEGLSFAAGRAWVHPTVYTELELLIAVVPADGGVAIRVDAEAIWLPQRTSAEHISGNVASVDVVRIAGVRSTAVPLGAAAARNLAGIVNGLPVLPPVGPHSCPGYVGAHDKLTFHGPDGEVVVEASTGGCGYVTVGDPGPTDPALGGAGTLDNAVQHAIGLRPPHR